jgi:hypothetical protein
VSLTLEQRIASYERAFPKCKGTLWIATTTKGRRTRRWLYGHFAIGNEYRNDSRYYGAYPRTYLDRIAALFPEMLPADTLHAFSGSLPHGTYTRVDSNPALQPELIGSVYDLPLIARRKFRLVMADPPYSALDAEQYGTAGVNRGKATAAIAQVTETGAHLVWLDIAWPMHRKLEWDYYGSIALVRSTNHRVRAISLFERKAAS